MAIGDDWTIDYINKIIYHSSGTTVYTVNELYTWLQDTFDELVQMDDEVPMSAQTPTEYTMINGWWLDIGESGGTNYSHRYLKTGAISTTGYDADSYNDGIRLLKFQSGGYTNAVLADIGTQVAYDSPPPNDTGTLLGFNNTLRQWWVRVDDTGDTFADTTESLSATTGGGTLEDPSTTGEELYANIYTLGTVATDPYAQVYVFQDGAAITEWSSLSNWDRGHIDVVIQVKEMGVEIDEAIITVYARQEGDLYDHFEIDLSAGGRNAVPLATATDLDNDETGSYFMLYDGETGGGFTVGDVITGATSGSVAELIDITDWGTEGVLTLTAVTGDFDDNENLQVSGTTRGVANGTAAGNALGDKYLTFGSQTSNLTNGDIILGATSGARAILVGQQDDGATGKLVLKVDPSASSNQDTYYYSFANGESLSDEGTGDGDTTAASVQTVAAWQDIQIFFVNLELDYDNETNGGFSVGDLVTGGTSGSTGYVLYVDDQGTSGTITLGNVDGAFQDGEDLNVSASDKGDANGTGKIIHTLNKTYEQGSPYPYDVIIDMNYYDIAEGNVYGIPPHTVARLYEYCKFVNRWDSTFSMYKVHRPYPDVVKLYDTSGSTFTDDRADFIESTADDVAVFDGDPETGDYFLIGWSDPFNRLDFNLTTQGVKGGGSWSVQWEYYNGAGWSQVQWQGANGVGESATDAYQFISATGWQSIWWDMPTNWAATTLDDDVSERYYVRCYVNSYSSPTTDPLLGQGYIQAIYLPEDGEEYVSAYYNYALKKASPLGTFAGGTFFGAQGVWIENMHTDDAQAYSLIDSNGTTRNPPNKQAVTVTSLQSGDRVLVARITGNGGDIDKDIYNSDNTANSQGDSTFVIQQSIQVDTPSSGIVRIVDEQLDVEYRMRYDSWATSTFTFPTEITSASDEEGDGITLYDADGWFTSADIEYGDIIRNSTDGSWAQITSIYASTLITTNLADGSNDDWGSGDTYSIHTIPNTLNSADTAYVPFLDAQSTGGSMSVTVIYTSDRDVLTRVRKKGIIPFEIEGDFISTGYTVAAIRTTDSIVS